MGAEPTGFPRDRYTPHGYLDNPAHSAVLNRSGHYRSVAPFGFGLWRCGLPWYRYDLPTHNYLALLEPGVAVDGTAVVTVEDVLRNRIDLVSEYHSKNLFSYDFRLHGIEFHLSYYVQRDQALFCRVEIRNGDSGPHDVRLDARLTYGFNERRWWGSDCVTARLNPLKDCVIAKILACGDVLVFGQNQVPSPDGFVTADRLAAESAMERGGTTGSTTAAVALPEAITGVLRYAWRLQPGDRVLQTLVLVRSSREIPALALWREMQGEADRIWNDRIREDDRFHQGMPRLSGDWPDSWRRAWVYDFETLRMNVREPIGIYRHPWDAMQVMAPRVVLGETAIDMWTMSLADPRLARDVLTGLFKDAPEPQVPCSREDGSVNMIGEDGSECGTAPIWGMPFEVIRRIFQNTGDVTWLQDLYPSLKVFCLWWKDHRTDPEGWYHCNNSWESGQDGSRRFRIEDEPGVLKEAANAERIRTADLEAAMASAFRLMQEAAGLFGLPDDQAMWKDLADQSVSRTRTMFVEDRFCDFDARTGRPTLRDDDPDPMLTMPIALGIATPEQMEACLWLFDEANRKEGKLVGVGNLKWPPILMTFVEAMDRSGLREKASRLVADTADRCFARIDSRSTYPPDPESAAFLPERYRYKIPGVGTETLSGDPAESYTENYGWGCLLPAMILRHIVGLRQPERLDVPGFVLSPAIPESFAGCYKVENLTVRGMRFHLELQREKRSTRVLITFQDGRTRCESIPEGGSVQVVTG